MKIFSIALNSVEEPIVRTLSTNVSETVEKAIASAVETSNKIFGNKTWVVVLSNGIDVQIPQMDALQKEIKDISKEIIEELGTEEEFLDKNWLLKTIIANKDKTLLKASKKYLNKEDVLYINSKIVK